MSKVGDYDFYCETALKPNANIVIEFENDLVLAFHHTKPSYEKHIVVIPKEHIHDIRDAKDEKLIINLILASQLILNSWTDEYIQSNGAKIVTNLGKFQDTPHLHFHIIGGNKLD